MTNAEHNCRFLKEPYPGRPNDGSFIEYNKALERARNDDFTIENRLEGLGDTMEKYMRKYFYPAITSKKEYECVGPMQEDVDSSKHFKIKRLFRKVSKTIKKIIRRKAVKLNKGSSNDEF